MEMGKRDESPVLKLRLINTIGISLLFFFQFHWIYGLAATQHCYVCTLLMCYACALLVCYGSAWLMCE